MNASQMPRNSQRDGDAHGGSGSDHEPLVMRDPLNCYRVEVDTTNSVGDTTYGPRDGQYLKCRNRTLFVLGKTFADVEKVVGDDMIVSVELIGIGYSA